MMDGPLPGKYSNYLSLANWNIHNYHSSLMARFKITHLQIIQGQGLSIRIFTVCSQIYTWTITRSYGIYRSFKVFFILKVGRKNLDTTMIFWHSFIIILKWLTQKCYTFTGMEPIGSSLYTQTQQNLNDVQYSPSTYSSSIHALVIHANTVNLVN